MDTEQQREQEQERQQEQEQEEEKEQEIEIEKCLVLHHFLMETGKICAVLILGGGCNFFFDFHPYLGKMNHQPPVRSELLVQPPQLQTQVCGLDALPRRRRT